MSKISEYVILTHSGETPLLEWLDDHKHRHYANLDESELLHKIARTEDTEARELMLELLGHAKRFVDTVSECHKEFDVISSVMRKIDGEELIAAAEAAKET